MDHAHIARVFDAGATESGRPYFVMELVRGIPITEYCDRNQLATVERLKLFVPICQAVQHAHQKGIIHRDIKPTNVLVTLHDGTPVPKVIDFGIAKATNQRLTEKTLFTEFQQFIGTPQYMSPEQAEMSGLDVDTRSDIYSLGVLLYELLTGTTPIDAETLRNASHSQMQRLIREEDPPSPSMRVSAMHDLSAVAKHRRIDPVALRKLFRGDLDWIVMKSLEKDRTRRYETAKDMAADIDRHLTNAPVLASPPGAAYRVRKFVRRHRVSVVTAAVVTIAMVLGLTLATLGFVQANREAQRANREAQRANREAQKSHEIADFLQEMLRASVDPDEASGHNVDAASILARAKELFGDDHATVAATLGNLALQLQHSGKLAAAEELYREALRLWKKLYGDEHVNVVITLNRLGSMLSDAGNDVGAEQSLRESVRLLERRTGPPVLSSCDARRQLARILIRKGQLDEAVVLLQDALRIQRSLPGDQSWQVAATLEQLAGVFGQQGKNEEAEQAMAEMLAAYQPLLPASSPQWAVLNAVYAARLRQNGRLERAEPYLREAVRIYRSMENPPRDYYVLTLDGLFQLLVQHEERTDETIDVFHETMENMAYLYGQDHLLLTPHLFGFAKLLEQRNHQAEAITLVVEGIRIHREIEGQDWNATPHLKRLERYCQAVASMPGLSAAKYEHALHGSHLLQAEEPGQLEHRVLQGTVLYRLQRYDEAHRQLASQRPRSTADSQASRSGLAFLAMTQFRLGELDASKQTLLRLQELCRNLQPASNDTGLAVVAEAEALIAGNQSG